VQRYLRFGQKPSRELFSKLLRIIFSSRRANDRGPAIFIDRDGVINCRRPGDYVLDWSQFVFIAGIRAALKQLSALRLPIIVISNQAAVGKGVLKADDLQKITAQLHQTLLADGTLLSAAYYCTHSTRENCVCRKPKPTLFYRAADDFNIDLRRSIFIGDSDTDAQAAQAAGCNPVLFGSVLCGCSDSLKWVTGLPAARTAEELLNVAVECLRTGRVASSDHAHRDSTVDI
jgi:D-glycero-D-manno-heptose 1,7-bisphosphate phosphatase